MAAQAIILCWLCWAKHTSSSTAGSAAAGPKGTPGTARGAEEFLKEALALWGPRQKIRLLRADSGFFDDKLLSFLEQRHCPTL
jgi:hypothetical protein